MDIDTLLLVTNKLHSKPIY